MLNNEGRGGRGDFFCAFLDNFVKVRDGKRILLWKPVCVPKYSSIAFMECPKYFIYESKILRWLYYKLVDLYMINMLGNAKKFFLLLFDHGWIMVFYIYVIDIAVSFINLYKIIWIFHFCGLCKLLPSFPNWL